MLFRFCEELYKTCLEKTLRIEPDAQISKQKMIISDGILGQAHSNDGSLIKNDGVIQSFCWNTKESKSNEKLKKKKQLDEN